VIFYACASEGKLTSAVFTKMQTSLSAFDSFIKGLDLRFFGFSNVPSL